MFLPNSVVMNHYPESDPENNAMSIVENRLLCSALRGEGAARAAARFVAVRQARHRRLEEKGLGDICVYEQGSEFNEGTPTFVEVRAGKPVSEVIDCGLQSESGISCLAKEKRSLLMSATMVRGTKVSKSLADDC